MKHVLKCGLMALMLCGFAGHAAAANTGGQIRVAVDFDRVTGCWTTNTGPDIHYNVEAVQPRTFVFIQLGKANPTKHDLARMSLTQMEGDAPVKLDKYNTTGFDVLYAVLPEAGLYSLNFGAAMPVTVCHSMENSFIDPKVKMPSPETLPVLKQAVDGNDIAYGEVMDGVSIVPAEVALSFGGNGCAPPYVGKATVFTFNIVRPNQYLFVATSGALRPQDDAKPNTWPNRVPMLLADDPSLQDNILEFSEYDELFGVVRLQAAAGYRLAVDSGGNIGRTGEVIVCQSSTRELPAM